MTKQQAERFVKKFNTDHTFTKIVSYEHERGLEAQVIGKVVTV
jgi:hypothetical protein